MNLTELNEILNNIKNVTVGMIGDICLDAYWHADMKLSVLSNETPHYPLPVVKETYSLGGGGNVVSNLAAVGVKRVIPVSVLGDDWRGAIVSKCLQKIGADCSYIITDKARVTPCYVKPMRHGISDVIYEDPRLDFENRSYPSKETEDKVIDALEKTAAEADIIAVCDQTLFGAVSPAVIEKLNEIGKKMPVVSDSHSHINQFRNVIVKPNEREAAAALNTPEIKIEEAARVFSQRNSAPAIITAGENGSVWCRDGKAVSVPAFKVNPPLDIVGAGDTFISAFCASYATGIPGEKALEFANLASSITVKKIGTTGTASPEELRAAVR